MMGVAGIRGQTEAVRGLHVDLHALPRREPVGEERRGGTEAGARADGIAHGIDGQMDLARRHQRGGGNGVEPRLQRLEAFEEGLRVGVDRPERLERGQHVESGGIAIGIGALGEELGLPALLAADEKADQLEQHVRGGAERVVLDQSLAEGLVANGKIRWRAHGGKNGIGERRIVAGEKAEAVTRCIADAAA